MRGPRSLRTRIFLALGGILGLVALVVMTHSLVSARAAAIEAEQRLAENVLRTTARNVQSAWRSLLFAKVELVQSSKARFRAFDEVVVATLTRFADAGPDAATAQAAAIGWLQQIRPVDGDYLLVVDAQGQVLVHPEQRLRGQPLLPDTVDFKGQPLASTVRADVAQYGETFVTFFDRAPGSDHRVPKFAHFTAFVPWNWLLASVGDVDAVQALADQRLAQFRAELARSLADVRVAGDGGVLVFDRHDQFIARPEGSGWLDANLLAGLRERLAADAGEGTAHTLRATDGTRLQVWLTQVRALDWSIAVVVPVSALNAPATRLVLRQGLVFALGLGLGLVLAYLVAGTIAGPLARLGAQARMLAEADFSRPDGAARAGKGLPLDRQDEIGALARAFAQMETALYGNVRELMAVTGERERIEGELDVARDIQLGLLPKVFPAFPERNDIDLHATVVSAREIGGDLYDFHLDGDRLTLTVGDVAGKGVPAALFMAITKTLMNAASESHDDPAGAIAEVNEHLARDNPNAMFVTAFHAELNLADGRLRYANGGHNPPLLWRAERGCSEWLRDLSGPALGAIDGMPFDGFETRLAPGDLLLAYTDGVTEAMDPEGQLYGEARLQALFERHAADASGGAMVATLMADIAAHAAGAEQSDDITVLVLRRVVPAEGQEL